MFASQLRRALLIVWFILSATTAVVLLAPLVVPASVIIELTGQCRLAHESCIFCGMTRAFLSISAGRFAEAASLNKGAAPLYLALLINEALLLLYLCREAVRRARRPQRLVRSRATYLKERLCKS